MSTGFGSYSPWTERQLEAERALLAKASANMIGEIHRRRFDGRLTREAAMELLDILGLAPAPPAERQNPGLTPPTAGDDTPEPAETLSGPPCRHCGKPTPVHRDGKARQFCSTRCYADWRTGMDLQPCGTMAAVRRHQRNHEPLCLACKQARTDYRRGIAERRAS